MENMTGKVERMARKNAKRRLWKRFVAIPAAVVVFVTTYALILPAIAMERDTYCGYEAHQHTEDCYTAELTCGYEDGQLLQSAKTVSALACTASAHQHTEECFDETGAVVCGYADYFIHEHNADCYDASGALVCPLPEVKAHTHDESCYVTETVNVCGKEESAGHVHDESCYTLVSHPELICGQAESAGHVHDESCYTTTEHTYLACGQEESAGHVHDENCYTVTVAEDGTETMELTCTIPESLGHTHTEACYVTEPVTELTCGQEESVGHVHTDACWANVETMELTCGQEESAGHTHDESCFAEQSVLVCTQPEVIPHVHTDECYTVVGYAEDGSEIRELTCPMTVVESHQHTADCFTSYEMTVEVPHQHTDLCYVQVLTCTLPEHEHTDDCYVAPEPEATEIPAEPEASAEPAEGEAAEPEMSEEPEATEAPAEPEYICGMEEHTHAEDCYDENNELICQLPEHVHDETCQAVEIIDDELLPAEPEASAEPAVEIVEDETPHFQLPILICGLEEHEHSTNCMDENMVYACGIAPHVHTGECYDIPGLDISPILTCALHEHSHSEACYDETGALTCGIEEHLHTVGCFTLPEGVEEPAEGEQEQAAGEDILICPIAEHTHSDECYDENGELICSLEEHTHSEGCYVVPMALICGHEAHTHTDACYDANGARVCLMEEHEHTANCYLPVSQIDPARLQGEKVLICDKHEHFHTELCYDENGELTCGMEEHIHNDSCYAQPATPLETSQSYRDGEIAVDIFYDETAGIPNGTELRVMRLEEPVIEQVILDAATGEQIAEAAEAEPEAMEEPEATAEPEEDIQIVTVGDGDLVTAVRTTVSYDIGLYLDGMEIEPNPGSQVNVRVTFLGSLFTDAENMGVTHYGADGAEDLALLGGALNRDEAGNVVIQFVTDSFSPFAFDSGETETAPEAAPDNGAAGDLSETVSEPETNNEPVIDAPVMNAPVIDEPVSEPQTNSEPLPASAPGYYQIDGFSTMVPVNGGDELKSRIEAAGGDEVLQISLKRSFDVSTTINVTNGQTVELDLSGFDLTSSASPLFNITNGSTVTIKNGGSGGPQKVTDHLEDVGKDADPVPVFAEYKEDKLTYAVMESTVENADTTGSTNEKQHFYTYKIHTGQGGGITSSGGYVFYMNGGNLDIESGVYVTGSQSCPIRADNGSHATLNGGCIYGNDNTKEYNSGGAARVFSSSTFTMTSGYIFNNSASSSGGAIMAGGGTEVYISGGVICGNKTDGDGGAIKSEGSLSISENAIISGNKAGGHGGGIYADKNFAMEGNVYVTNNEATRNDFKGGGGIMVWSGTANISGGYITGNKSWGYGGGIGTEFLTYSETENHGTLNIKAGTYICHNVVQNNEGGGICITGGWHGVIDAETGYIYINNNKTNTSENWGGGGLFIGQGGTCVIYQTLVTGNTAGGYGGGVAGCSTGRILGAANVGLDAQRQGAAIFGNEAAGKNLSGNSSTKHEDHTNAERDPVFTRPGEYYQDVFCALFSGIDATMLGGGSENWTGTVDGVAVERVAEGYLTSNYAMGLTAEDPTNTDAAYNSAHVFIEGNHSYTHGGGILCNGILSLGPKPDEIVTYASVLLSTWKNYKNGDNDLAMTAGQFKFTLSTDYDGKEVIATGMNSASVAGSPSVVEFRNLLTYKSDDLKEETKGEDGKWHFTYYARETETVGVEIDPHIYRIQLTIDKIQHGEVDLGEVTTYSRYEVTDVQVDVQDTTGTHSKDDPWTPGYQEIDGDYAHQQTVWFGEQTKKGFVNKKVTETNIRVWKQWRDSSGDIISDQNDERYNDYIDKGVTVKLQYRWAGEDENENTYEWKDVSAATEDGLKEWIKGNVTSMKLPREGDGHPWRYTFEKLPTEVNGHQVEYRVVEDPVDGYTANYLDSYKDGAVYVFPIVNEPKTYGFDLKKVSGVDGKILAEVEFQLYAGTDTTGAPLHFNLERKTVIEEQDGQQYSRFRDVYVYDKTGTGTVSLYTNGDGGCFYVEGLPAGTYTLVEPNAPEGLVEVPNLTFELKDGKAGYTELPAGWERKDDASESDFHFEFVATDPEETYELPETGGMGTMVYTLSGMALIALAGAAFCARRRRAARG